MIARFRGKTILEKSQFNNNLRRCNPINRLWIFRGKSYPGLELQTFTYFGYIEICAVSRRLGISELFNVESVKTYIMDLSKREKPPWTKFREEPWPKKKKKRRKANICRMKAGGGNLKIKPTRANSWRRPRCLWRSLQLFFSFAD